MTGLTPGTYANRTGKYEVRADGTIWLTGGADLSGSEEPRRVEELPRDAALTHAALGGPTQSGSTPPGKGQDPADAHRGWGDEKA